MNSESEIWKPVVGAENNGYEVSSFGNLRRNGVLMNPSMSKMSIEKHLRRVATIRMNNEERKLKKVPRLVAEAFIPNQLNKPEVNHIDGDRRNDRLENLEWVTRCENMNHAVFVIKKNHFSFGRKPKLKKLKKPIYYVYTKSGLLIEKVYKKVDLKRKFDVTTKKNIAVFQHIIVSKNPIESILDLPTAQSPKKYVKKPISENLTAKKRKKLYIYNCLGEFLAEFESKYAFLKAIGAKKIRKMTSYKGYFIRTEYLQKIPPAEFNNGYQPPIRTKIEKV